MIAWKIGGDQGEGIDSTGDVLATVANRMGYFVYGYKTFSSRIKGGHTNYKVRISTHPVQATTRQTDILVALNQETIDKNAMELDGGLLMADSAFDPQVDDRIKANLLTLPFTQMAKDLGSVVMRNMVAVGASVALLQLPVEPFADYVADKFRRKGESVMEANRKAITEGYQRIRDHYSHLLTLRLDPPTPGDRVVVNGNDMTALGALAGGCRIFCGYPITPATDIMEALIKWFPSVGGAVVQMEDELGSITAAIGAGFAGARSMTATSGPGISLMQEAMGLAAMAEIPVVIVDTQRGGPSTGMPTKQEQSDLLALLNGGHGEGPRIVLTPGSPEEAFTDAAEAFNLAERYQTPVIIATDLSLALWTQTVERKVLTDTPITIDRGPRISRENLVELGKDAFKRYELTETGVSPRSVPGQPYGQYLATGAEHSAQGKVSEDPANRVTMMDKRLAKVRAVNRERAGIQTEGPANADLVLVGINSTTGIIREAKALLEAEGYRIAIAWLRTLAPFPAEQVQEALAKAKKVLVVEQNATAQLLTLLRANGVADSRYLSHLKYDGVPIVPEEIVERVKAVLKPVEVV